MHVPIVTYCTIYHLDLQTENQDIHSLKYECHSWQKPFPLNKTLRVIPNPMRSQDALINAIITHWPGSMCGWVRFGKTRRSPDDWHSAWCVHAPFLTLSWRAWKQTHLKKCAELPFQLSKGTALAKESWTVVRGQNSWTWCSTEHCS